MSELKGRGTFAKESEISAIAFTDSSVSSKVRAASSIMRQHSFDSYLTRRDFVSSIITIAGGIGMFSFSGRALASDRSTATNLIHNEMGFVDSLGRLIDIAQPVRSVVPLGVYAQTLIETLFPGSLASLAKEVFGDADDFVDAGLVDIVGLAETGAIKTNVGKKVDFAQIAALKPDIVLQAGIPHSDDIEDLEWIQTKTGALCVFLDVSYGKLQESYRKLGRLLGCEQRAEELASYIENTQIRAVSVMNSEGSKTRVFYAPRVAGKKVTTGVAVQVDVMLQLGLEPVTRPYDFESRTVDFTALAKENPDFILIDDTSFPAAVFSYKNNMYKHWKGIRAIGEGRFAVAPALIHSILGSAIFVQSIGMLWIAHVVSPSRFKYNMAAEMARYYQLFYGLERDEDTMARLLGIVVEDG